jgi:hypothetical protein
MVFKKIQNSNYISPESLDNSGEILKNDNANSSTTIPTITNIDNRIINNDNRITNNYNLDQTLIDNQQERLNQLENKVNDLEQKINKPTIVIKVNNPTIKIKVKNPENDLKSNLSENKQTFDAEIDTNDKVKITCLNVRDLYNDNRIHKDWDNKDEDTRDYFLGTRKLNKQEKKIVDKFLKAKFDNEIAEIDIGPRLSDLGYCGFTEDVETIKQKNIEYVKNFKREVKEAYRVRDILNENMDLENTGKDYIISFLSNVKELYMNDYIDVETGETNELYACRFTFQCTDENFGIRYIISECSNNYDRAFPYCDFTTNCFPLEAMELIENKIYMNIATNTNYKMNNGKWEICTFKENLIIFDQIIYTKLLLLKNEENTEVMKIFFDKTMDRWNNKKINKTYLLNSVFISFYSYYFHIIQNYELEEEKGEIYKVKINEYRYNNYNTLIESIDSIVMKFITNTFISTKNEKDIITFKDIYIIFNNWCIVNKYDIISITTFGKMFKSYFINSKRMTKGIVYTYIKLK